MWAFPDRGRHLTVRTKLLWAFALPVVVAAGLTLEVARTTDRTLASERRVSDGNRAVAGLNSVVRTAIDAETGMRGFVLTGEPQFLAPFDEAVARFDRRWAELRSIVADDPAQVGRLTQIQARFHEWEHDVATPRIAARRRAPVGMIEQIRRFTRAVGALNRLTDPFAEAEGTWDDLMRTARSEAAKLVLPQIPADTVAYWSRAPALLDVLEQECPHQRAARSKTCGAAIEELRVFNRAGSDKAWALEDAVNNLSVAETGRTLMESLRHEAEAFQSRQQADIDAVAMQSSTAVWTGGAEAVIVLVLTLGGVFSFAFLTIVRTARAAEAVAAAAKALEQGDKTQRADVSTSDEFGVMARALNFMAEHLSTRERVDEKRQDMALDAVFVEQRERRRIAADLHDRIGQSLTATRLKIRSVTGSTAGPVRAALEEASAILEQTIEDTSTLTFDLSPPILYDLGLPSALGWLAERMRERHGLNVDVETGTIPRMADEIAALLFRVIQELLMNVVKHAATDRAAVSVHMEDDRLLVEVSDRGVGFDPTAASRKREGFGLFSVRDQVTRLGGRFNTESAPGAGSKVRFDLPVTAVPTQAPGRAA